MEDEGVVSSDLAAEGIQDTMEPGEPTPYHARLVVVRGGVETEEQFTFLPPAVVGRFDPDRGPVDIDLGPLPEGSYVSRRHARIEHVDGVWRIQDLESSNGTFLRRDDFERVENAELADGDEIALGNARFIFRLVTGQGEPHEPEPEPEPEPA